MEPIINEIYKTYNPTHTHYPFSFSPKTSKAFGADNKKSK